jgi:GxxExxY protein
VKSGEINVRTGQVVDAAMRVHSRLGPGLLEGANEACLAYELRERGLSVLVQQALPVEYDGARIDIGYRADLIVDAVVIVELKAIAKLQPIHEAQLLSYLKAERLSCWSVDQLPRAAPQGRHQANGQQRVTYVGTI